MPEQMNLFEEHLGDTLKPYFYNWDFRQEQYRLWEADPKNTGNQIFNSWYGTIEDGVIVNRRLKYKDESLTGDILMFHVFHGGDTFTEEPAPYFKKYEDYPTESYL